MIELFQEIYRSLREGKQLILATIISHRGSTPRTSGAGMVVYGDGTISGTIGGGKVEGEVINAASRLFETKGAQLSFFNLKQTGQADDMDLVCGGEMQVLLELFSPRPEVLGMFRAINEQITRGQSFLWLGKVTETGAQYRVERAVHTVEGDWIGTLQAESGLQKRVSTFNPNQKEDAFFDIDNHPYLIESILSPKTVYLMGAGHVSKEIALLTKQVGFKTLVYDDRAEFANVKNFPGVDGVFVCNDFEKVFAEFNIPAGGYIVIVTRGHRCDKDVLAQALRSDAEYIGMIGSRNKRESLYRDLTEEGFDRTVLEQVHCPIGLPIRAESPAEIAVSVVAELIKYRAER